MATKNTNLMGGANATHSGLPKTAPKKVAKATVKAAVKTNGGTN